MKTCSDLSLHESCAGCGRITEVGCCGIYLEPTRQWTRVMGCSARTHNKVVSVEDKKQLNPLKASKRRVKQ